MSVDVVDHHRANHSPIERGDAKGGNLVPKGHEVSHKKPLYTKRKGQRCTIDKEKNLETLTRSDHRALHSTCGMQFHLYPR